MKFLSHLFRTCPFLGAFLLLSLFSPAQAGHWENATLIWSGHKKLKEIHYFQAPVEGRLFGIREKTTKVAIRANAGSYSWTGYPDQANVYWGNEGSGPYGDNVEFFGPIASKATDSQTTSSAHAVMKWKRDSLYGTQTPDPNDNPPKFLYVTEKVGIHAAKSTFAYGRVLPAYENTPWPADFVTVSGYAGSRDLKVTLDANKWQYAKSYDANGATYGYGNNESKVRVRRYAVKNDTVSLGSISFNGTAALGAGYERPEDSAQGTIVISCSYEAKPVNLNLYAVPQSIIRYIKNQPADKEIDAEAHIALRIVQTEDGPITRPFWLGQADFLASATRDENGTTRDLYDLQKYQWAAQHAPAIPIAAPEEQTPIMIIGNIIDNANPVVNTWNKLQPWAKTTIKLAAQAAIGEEETAVDGRPLATLKTTVSRPDKHFYWDLGEIQSDFPISTDAQVVFTNDTAPDAAGPAKARINWQLPTRIVYDVEIGLWDWTNSQDPDQPTWEEWKERLLTDDNLAKTIATDVALEVVSIIPVGRVATGAKSLVFRIILNKKVPARTVVGVVDRAAVGITKTGPPRPWHRSHKIRSIVKDAVDRADVPTPDPNQQPDPQTSPTTQPTQTSEEKNREQEREAKRESYIASPDFYLYYKGTDYKTNFWPGNPDNPLHDNWPVGYYLTDMPPTVAEAIASGRNPSQVASELRCGQHSFAMFGYPYQWGETGTVISWVKVGVGDLMKIEGNTTTLERQALTSQGDYPLVGIGEPDKSVTYRNWPYHIYMYKGDSTTNPIYLDPKRISTPRTVTFKNDIPHISSTVFDGSPGALDVPGSSSPLPGRDRGIWYVPDSNPRQLLPTPIYDVDSQTGLPRQSNSDWLPPDWTHGSRDFISPITNVDANGNRVPMRYRRGYPIFNPYAEITIELNPMQGNESWVLAKRGDFIIGTEKFATATGRSFTDAKNWITSTGTVTSPNPTKHDVPTNQVSPLGPRWVWHHHQDMRHMQLVPSSINTGRYGGAPHKGGASWAALARW